MNEPINNAFYSLVLNIPPELFMHDMSCRVGTSFDQQAAMFLASSVPGVRYFVDGCHTARGLAANSCLCCLCNFHLRHGRCREAPSADVMGKFQSADCAIPNAFAPSALAPSRVASFLEVLAATCFRFEINRMTLKYSPIDEHILLADGSKCWGTAIVKSQQYNCR